MKNPAETRMQEKVIVTLNATTAVKSSSRVHMVVLYCI